MDGNMLTLGDSDRRMGERAFVEHRMGGMFAAQSRVVALPAR
jgi:hypothetical protein